MILGLSSIREDSNENDQGQTPKIALHKSVQSNLIPALHQNVAVQPFVPEVYSMGVNKRNMSTNVDSFTNVSISKLVGLHQNSMTKGLRDLESLRMDELPENPLKNPTSFDLVGLEDLHKTNRISSDKIDSFLEVTNRIFKKDVPLMSSLQLTDLINKDANNKVYLPARRFKFKGINVKHSIAIVGSPESVLNFYESGFNFAETPDYKELDLQQTNIKLHDPLKLFSVHGHSCSISLQNSVIQCSHKNLTSLKQGSRLVYVTSPNKRPIDKIIIQIESTVIQNFDTLLEIEDGVEIGMVHIRICSAKLYKFSRLLDLRSCNVKVVKIELIGSFFDTVSSLFTVNSPFITENTLSAYKNTFLDCKTIVDVENISQFKSSIGFIDNTFISCGLVFNCKNLDIPFIVARCIFKSGLNRCLVVENCKKVILRNCCFLNNKTDTVVNVIDSQLEFYKNVVLSSSDAIFTIMGNHRELEKLISIHDNKFVRNLGLLVKIDKNAKKILIDVENNIFEAESLPFNFGKLSTTTKITIKTNEFKLASSKPGKIKTSKSVKAENNVFEFGAKFDDFLDGKKEPSFDQAFYSENSQQDIVKLFGEQFSSIN